jgi:hypothetical protein
MLARLDSWLLPSEVSPWLSATHPYAPPAPSQGCQETRKMPACANPTVIRHFGTALTQATARTEKQQALAAVAHLVGIEPATIQQVLSQL